MNSINIELQRGCVYQYIFDRATLCGSTDGAWIFRDNSTGPPDESHEAMPLLKPLVGRVSLLFDSTDQAIKFSGANEPVLVNHSQLPQFLPRVVWPNYTGAGLHKYNSKLKTDSVDWNDPAEVQALHRNVNAAYPNLQPMQPFHDVNDSYQGAPWRTHVAAMHNVMFRTIAKSEPLEEIGMSALLRTISYGMFDTMTFLDTWHVAGPQWITRRSHSYPDQDVGVFTMRMKQASFTQSGNNELWHLDRMMGRRWIVVPVKYGNGDWGMTIFDRHNKQLLIFDTCRNDERVARAEACTHLWARFWNWLDMPFSFVYFMPAVSELPKDVQPCDSGLTAAIWVMLNLRNQVGEYMDPSDPSIVRRDIMILHEVEAMPLTKSSLPLHDWVPDGCRNARQGMAGVRRMLQVLACNELGLENWPDMKKPFGGGIGAPTPAGLLAKAKFYMATDTGFPRDEFWTGNGGPQFSAPEMGRIKPYNERAIRGRYRPQNAVPQDRFHIAKRYRQLTTRNRPSQAIVWPGRGFTVNQPYRRCNSNIRLSVTQLDELDDLATDQKRYLEIQMRNALAQDGLQDIEPSLEILIRPEWITQNGNRVVRLRVEAYVGDDAPLSIPVDILVPPNF